MKRALIISLLVAAMGMIAFVGCEKEDTMEIPVVTKPQTTPVTHNTTLSYTGCHSSQSKGYYDPIVTTEYENGVLLLNIDNFHIDCGKDSVSSEIEFDNQTINVNLFEIGPNSTNCTCPIDVDYSIDNIKPNTYELIISQRGWIFYQEEITCE